MSKTIGHPDDDDFKQDLDLVVRKLPGYGAALGRIIERAGITQQELAERVKCDRSTFSHWIAERKWPKSAVLMETLVSLNIDRKLLAEASTVLFGGDITGELFRKCGHLNTQTVTAEQMQELLKGEDDFTQLDMIFKVMYPRVVFAQALRAAGLKGAESADPRAAQWLAGEYEKHQNEAKRRTLGGDKKPTEEQQDWSAGKGVYQEASKETEPGLAEISND